MLLQLVVEVHNPRKQNRDINYSNCLEEIKKCIRYTYEYFYITHSVCWKLFFNNQSDIISRTTNEDIPLKNTFIWPQNVSNEYGERNIVEQQQSQGIINSSQAEEREMYIGSRRSCAKREAMEDHYRGSVQDIKEGCMITVIVDGDPNGYPLWVAKVIKVITENQDVAGVEVHWYATNTHPFNSVYKPEMVVEKNIGGKRKRKGTNINQFRTNLLKLEDVDILVYDFN